jgi:predicted amidohydrolase
MKRRAAGPHAGASVDRSRRDWLQRALLAGTAGAAGTAMSGAAPAGAAARPRGAQASVGVQPDGRYATVPLARERLRLALVQTRFSMIDPANVAGSRAANLRYMLEWIDRAQSGPRRHDLLMFHELPLTGLSMQWDRRTILSGCIEVPGVETEAISAKAREHGCWVVFGAYVVDRDWPNHYLSITTIIGPDGAIVDRQWKARNIMGSLGGIELMTTTIFNVLDRYVEMYGWDRVIPVARTPIGNIATSSVQLEPELFRAFAIKGAEIVLRTATGRFRMADVQGAALHNGYWTAMVNNAYLPDDPEGLRRYWPDGDWRRPTADSTTVLSSIVDARGNLVAQATTPEEQVVAFEVPIAEHRAQMRQPVVHEELYAPVWDAYVGRYPPDAYLRRQPDTVQEAARQLDAGRRWKD